MRVLVIEDEIGTSTQVLDAVCGGGHEVLRCQPLDGQATPCLGLSGGSCPFDGDVDAVIDVRAAGHSEANLRELGAECARRMGVDVLLEPWSSPRTWRSPPRL